MRRGFNKFVHLTREYGSFLSMAERMVVVVEDKSYVGQGGCLCDVRLPDGKLQKQVSLDIVLNENKEEVVYIRIGKNPSRLIEDEELSKMKFCFNNLDY